MFQSMTRTKRAFAILSLSAALIAGALPARAENYSAQEIVDSGHRFFGATSGGLATVVEKIFASYGLPNGYVLGEEGSGAFVGGLTYGEGTMYTKNAGDHRVFWQGPSVGFDFGGQGSRTMMLVYNMDDVSNVFNRFAGVAGSAYVVAGVGFTALKHGDVVLVPVRPASAQGSASISVTSSLQTIRPGTRSKQDAQASATPFLALLPAREASTSVQVKLAEAVETC